MRMNFQPADNLTSGRRASGWTLIEMMISLGIGLVVVTMMSVLYVFGLRSFTAMSNYADMDGKSRYAMDVMLKEIRQSSQVLGFQQTGSAPYLTVACTNFSPTVTNTFTWQTNRLTWDKWMGATHTTKTLLRGCDSWTFTLYTRAPDTNGNFVTNGVDQSNCKLINMSWKCSRNDYISKINTESMTTAEVVLRNLQE